VERIPNHISRATDKSLDELLEKNHGNPTAILFTEKGTTSALIRALAIDFKGAIKFLQIRNKETSSVQKFGIEKFPSLVLLPGGDKEAITYDGELKKTPIIDFLSQVAAPNPDPAPKESKKQKSSKSTSKEEAGNKPTESPEPEASSSDEAPRPAASHEVAPLPDLSTPESLTSACFQPKSGTCVLALVTAQSSESELPAPATQALTSLAEIAHKHSARDGKLFPFYSVPGDNAKAATLKTSLGVSGEVELVAVNARRGWWRRYEGKEGFGHVEVEAWIDAIRLGEGSKEKLPAGVVPEEEEVRDEL
jgi:protein disulfide-isomerase A6